MKNLKRTIIPLLICFIPVVAGIMMYKQLPEQLPTHFNFAGEADSYGSKNLVLFGLPLLFGTIILLMPVILKADPKYQNLNMKLVDMTVYLLAIISCAISFATMFIALGKNVDINIVMNLIVSLMFIVIGNYLPKASQSYMVGIKLPWTLNSEENWKRTHRFGGFVWVFAGVIMLLNVALNSKVLLIGAIVLATLVPSIYSYMLFRKGI